MDDLVRCRLGGEIYWPDVVAKHDEAVAPEWQSSTRWTPPDRRVSHGLTNKEIKMLNNSELSTSQFIFLKNIILYPQNGRIFMTRDDYSTKLVFTLQTFISETD